MNVLLSEYTRLIWYYENDIKLELSELSLIEFITSFYLFNTPDYTLSYLLYHIKPEHLIKYKEKVTDSLDLLQLLMNHINLYFPGLSQQKVQYMLLKYKDKIELINKMEFDYNYIDYGQPPPPSDFKHEIKQSAIQSEGKVFISDDRRVKLPQTIRMQIDLNDTTYNYLNLNSEVERQYKYINFNTFYKNFNNFNLKSRDLLIAYWLKYIYIPFYNEFLENNEKALDLKAYLNKFLENGYDIIVFYNDSDTELREVNKKLLCERIGYTINEKSKITGYIVTAWLKGIQFEDYTECISDITLYENIKNYIKPPRSMSWYHDNIQRITYEREEVLKLMEQMKKQEQDEINEWEERTGMPWTGSGYPKWTPPQE